MNFLTSITDRPTALATQAAMVFVLLGTATVAHAQLSDPPDTGVVTKPPCIDGMIGCGNDGLSDTAQAAGTDTAAAAGVSETKLTFEPHCINVDRRNCPAFQAVSGDELSTATLRAGDILDVDVVLETPTPADVGTVRAWLEFDTNFLEARSVELTTAMPQPIPGEQAIDSVGGVIKIGGGTNGALTTTRTAVARVTFRVKSTSANTSVRFRNFSADNNNETSVTGKENAVMLKVQPTSLTVRLSTEQASSSSAGSMTFLDLLQQRGDTAAAQGTGAGSTQAVGGPNSAFTLLQVQNVRVTSKDTNIFLGWQNLTSTDLAGYNVYYGTVSGRYIQRRSVPESSNSLVIRDLEPATQYYLAVRGYNSNNQETVFSHEVTVIVGKPETSSAPLNAIDEGALPPTENPIETYNGKNVTETGVDSTLALLALASAGIGTFFAWRRQLLLSRSAA